jgi:hypothetical protein
VISKYHELTLDKAFIEGEFYSDKAPLSTIVVLPFSYFVLSEGLPIETKIKIINRLAIFITANLTFLSLMILLLLVNGVQNHQELIKRSLVIMLIFYSSNLYIYTNEYWGHLLATFLSVISLHLLLDKKAYALSGLFLGLAIATEYTMSVFAIIWFFCLLSEIKEVKLKSLILWCLGISIPVIALAYYHYYFTGNPFTPLYSYVHIEEFQPMTKHLGFNWPDLMVFLKLLISPHRGMFIYSPLLCLIIPMIILKRKNNQRAFIYIILAALGLLTLNSSYFMWHGGWCHGPRHLLPILGLILYLFTQIDFNYQKYLKNFIFIFLALTGISLNVAVKVIGPTYSQNIQNPYVEYVVPKILGMF